MFLEYSRGNFRMQKFCVSVSLNHIHGVQMAYNDLSESKMTISTPYGPCRVVEPIFTKMIPCPGVGLLKMIPCSAARPRTEKYISAPPGLRLRLNIFSFFMTFPIRIATCPQRNKQIQTKTKGVEINISMIKTKGIGALPNIAK